jgi:hypothetical protein
MNIATFLQEDNRNYSLVRLIPVTLCLASIAFGALAIFLDSPLASDLAEAFLAATCGALTAKIIQKPFEEKLP